MLEIIEKFTLSKTNIKETSEDAYFISDNYIAVIDGATSKNSKPVNGKTGGQLIKDSILMSLNLLDGTEDFDKAISFIHNNIIKNLPEEKYGNVSASAVIYSVKQNEIWSVGDCQIMINSKLISKTHKIDELLSELRILAMDLLKEEGFGFDDFAEKDVSREMIMPFLEKQKYLANKKGKYGYFCFNNVPLKDIEYSDIVEVFALNENSEVVLASDGYPFLKETLKESEEELLKVLKEDPLCCTLNPSTKGIVKGNRSFDDRTYLRFKTGHK